MIDLVGAIADLKSGFPASKLDFSLDHIMVAGRRFGSIPEWESRLTMDGDGNAALFRRRGPGNSAQMAPGRYTGSISKAHVIELLEALGASGIQNLESEAPGPRDPINFLRIMIQGRLFTYSWGPIPPPAPVPFLKLRNLLSECAQYGCPNPAWSLTLEADSIRFSQGRLLARLIVVNRGSQGIHIAHPASSGLGTQFGMQLEYGEAQLIEEGISPDPIDSKIISLKMDLLHVPEFIEITPDHPFQLEFAAFLEGQAPRGWVGKFRFIHYMPEDSIAGISVFNGALFSEEKSW